MANSCKVCEKRVLSHSKSVSCIICKRKYHCKCISIKKIEITRLLAANDWYCITCISEALPFNQIDEDIEFQEALSHKDHFEIHWDSIYEKE